MKFLVIATLKTTSRPTPELVSRYKSYVEDKVREGVFDVVYSVADKMQNICIANADSREQLNRILEQIPSHGMADLDIYPLTDFSERMKAIAATTKG